MNSFQKYYIFLKEKNITQFNELKEFVQQDCYKLKIKEDKELDNVALIYSNHESNINEELVLFFNGVIIEKSSLKIICYTFDKCKEDNIFEDKLLNSELYIEPTYEGTLIRLFHYNNKWNISTKKMINALNARWTSSKSFGEMFLEIFDSSILEKLNKDHCYSFVMSHNDNNIIYKYSSNFLIHISSVDLMNQVEIESDIGIKKNTRIKIEFEKEKLLEYIEDLKNNTSMDESGYILINTNYVRQKINKKNYLYYRNLWGNTNNRLFRYLHLRKNNELLVQYLNFFKDDKVKFLNYEHYLINISNFILNLYRSKFMLKQKINTPFYLKDIIYKIHGLYLKTKNKVTFQDINVLLYELDEKKFCFIINHIEKDMKKYEEEQRKIKEQEEQETKMQDDTVIHSEVNNENNELSTSTEMTA